MAVSVKVGGKAKQSTVHKLVALAFHGERPPGSVVCHNNGNPFDNQASNLRHDSQKGNISDTLAFNQGSKNGRSKLNENSVAHIKTRLENGEPISHIASDFGVSIQTVWCIKAGKTWNHVA